MSEEVKRELEKLGKTVADFQELNNRAIDEIKKNGVADPLTAQAVDKANKAIDDIKDNLKALQTRQDEFETSMNRPDMGGKSEKKDTRAEALAWFVAATDGKIEEVSDAQVKEYENAKLGFKHYLKHGNEAPYLRKNPEIYGAMSVGSNADGGFWAPTEMVNNVVKRVFETSPMRQIADQITIGAADAEWPKDTNDITSGGWTGETSSRSDTNTPQVGMQKVPAHEQFAQPKATQKFLDDAMIDVEAWLTGKISDKISRDENTAFVSGNGVARPRGFLSYGTDAVTTQDATRNWGVLQYVPSGASGGFALISGLVADDANPLITLIHSMKQSLRAQANFLMNRNVAGSVRKLRDANGRYLWQDSLILGQPDRLLGYSVVEAEDMPDLASNSLSIAFGNFKLGYRIVDRTGMRILRDPFTDKPFVKFYATKRVGGDVVNFDAIKLLKMAAS